MDQIERKKIEQIKKWTKLKKFFFLPRQVSGFTKVSG